MSKEDIVKTLSEDLDLLQEVLSDLKHFVHIEVSKDKYNEWDVEICDVQDAFIGDNGTVVLVVEAFL